MSSTIVACTLYFDGACPLCRGGSAHYRSPGRMEAVAWADVAACDEAMLGDLSRDAALARLHVRRSDRSLVSGAAAFAAVWKRLSAHGWLTDIASRSPMLKIMDAAYSGLLHMRPLWRCAGTSGQASAEALSQSVCTDLRADHATDFGGFTCARADLIATLTGFAVAMIRRPRSSLAEAR